VAAGRRIAYVSDSRVALQLDHMLLLKHIANESASLAYVQFAFAGGGDAGGVLSAVLQNGQRVIDSLIDRAGSDDADDSTHVGPPLSVRQTIRLQRLASCDR